MTSATSHSSPARYRWTLLHAGPFWLDGGSMFGVVPAVVWKKLFRADEKGRIGLALNCLLLDRIDPPAGAPRRLIIETGAGNKLDPKTRAIYNTGDRWLGDALREAAIEPDSIDRAIVSHLHFDHCGGLTRLARDGESPDWVSADGRQRVKLTFPNAPIIVQRREWEDALSNTSHMTRTYFRENLEPLRQRLTLVDSPLPFAPGCRPRRDELPASPLAHRQTPAAPGIHVFAIPGHTWGLQAISFTDDRGRTVVFSSDLLPTAAHVGAAYNMAYDVEPYTSTITRGWFLKAALEHDWLLVLDHEPDNPIRRVRTDGRGWYQLEEAT